MFPAQVRCTVGLTRQPLEMTEQNNSRLFPLTPECEVAAWTKDSSGPGSSDDTKVKPGVAPMLTGVVIAAEVVMAPSAGSVNSSMLTAAAAEVVHLGMALWQALLNSSANQLLCFFQGSSASALLFMEKKSNAMMKCRVISTLCCEQEHIRCDQNI